MDASPGDCSRLTLRAVLLAAAYVRLPAAQSGEPSVQEGHCLDIRLPALGKTKSIFQIQGNQRLLPVRVPCTGVCPPPPPVSPL